MKDYIEQATGVPPLRDGIWFVDVWVKGVKQPTVLEPDPRLQSHLQVIELTCARRGDPNFLDDESNRIEAVFKSKHTILKSIQA